jgi:hypothetical protein
MIQRQTQGGTVSNPFRVARIVILALAVLCSVAPTARAQAPGDGPGGPILVVVNDGENRFGRYYAEILRAEGLNEFEVAGVGALNPQTLAAHQVVLLAQTSLTPGQAAILGGWVNGGGNLIAMRPDADLSGLLGIAGSGGTLADAYLKVDGSRPPGTGIVEDTMQFHGTADRYALNGASSVATLYGNASTATPAPAVTLRSVGGAGGEAAAFTYDLARSVVYTRQGNPSWAGQELDGTSPRRSDDLFFGAGADGWLDRNKVHIPQADEQQRLLANLITHMNLDRAPLPRFWYLPRGLPAAVVMTGDDHGTGGTTGQFDRFEAQSPAGCSVADWGCIRSTSYVFPGTPVPGAAGYLAKGFELALHLQTDCSNQTDATLESMWSTQAAAFTSQFGSLPLRTNRTHCIAWSGWVNDAVIERAHGVRLDTNYYYWPGTWALSFPGMFTGSGFPMRFADADGTLVDVYQAATQLTDEWGASQTGATGVAQHIEALLTRATGPQGYYGVFTANMHTDHPDHPGANAIVAAAKARGVPVVSAAQMLDWLDTRNGSSFQDVSFTGGRLHFRVARAGGANGLEAMLPAGGLTSLTRDGVPVGATPRAVKGIEYRVFPAVAGAYEATYDRPGAGSAPRAPSSGTARVRIKGRRDGLRRAKVVRHRARVSATGIARLQVRCPRRPRRCRVDVRLRRGGEVIAKRSVTLTGGRSTKVRLRLTPRARRQLARAGSMRVRAVLRLTNGEAAPIVTRTRVRLLAP